MITVEEVLDELLNSEDPDSSLVLNKTSLGNYGVTSFDGERWTVGKTLLEALIAYRDMVREET